MRSQRAARSRRSSKRIGVLALVSFAFAACAESVPGVGPPRDQLYYPAGIVAVPGPLDEAAFVVVVNSNFDQRFNAGTAMVLSVDEIFAAVAGTSSTSQVSFEPNFEDARVSSVRVDQFGSDIVFVPERTSAPGAAAGPDPVARMGTLLMASRGHNWLTLLDLDADGRISCGADEAEEAPVFRGLDCTPGHVLRTGQADPTSVIVLDGDVAGPMVAVGHLETQDTRVVLGTLDSFLARREREREECAGLGLEECIAALGEEELFPVAVDLPGVSGLAHIPSAGSATPPSRPDLGKLLVAARRETTAGPDLALSVVSMWSNGTSEAARFRLAPSRLSIGGLTRATELRGVAVRAGTPSTAESVRHYVYLSARFRGRSDNDNSALVVVRVEEDPVDSRRDRVDVISVLELGDELLEPFLLEHPSGAKLVYLPDMRADKIWIVDVTAELPIVVGAIGGRVERILDGESYAGRTLDAPAAIAFVERDRRVLGLAANFANSTVAVLDLSSAQPSEHRVIARLGRDIDAEGRPEGPK